jgi:hypothetical protein
MAVKLKNSDALRREGTLLDSGLRRNDEVEKRLFTLKRKML